MADDIKIDDIVLIPPVELALNISSVSKQYDGDMVTYDLVCNIIGYSNEFCMSLLLPATHTKEELHENIGKVAKTRILHQIGL